MSTIVRPPVLGIFGGGQLARMTAVSAQAYGFAVRVLDPDPHCPAAVVCDELITAEYDDVTALTVDDAARWILRAVTHQPGAVAPAALRALLPAIDYVAPTVADRAIAAVT